MDRQLIIARCTETASACHAPEMFPPLNANTLAAVWPADFSQWEVEHLFSFAGSTHAWLIECILAKANAVQLALALIQ